VGDFYETFGADAIVASRILGLRGQKEITIRITRLNLQAFLTRIGYLFAQIGKGRARVAICDQLEDPKLAKGLVKRGVTEMVTRYCRNDSFWNAITIIFYVAFTE